MMEQQINPPPRQSQKDQSKSRFSTIPKKIDFLNDCQIVLNKQYAHDNSVLFNMTHFVGIAFVSFQYQHYRDFILMQTSTDNKFLEYNGKYLEVQIAAHPSQVYWTNLRISKKNRQIRAIVSYLILVMVLVFAFLFLSLAEIMKQVLRPVQPQLQISFISLVQNYWAILVATLFILLINFILSKTIHSLTKFEKHQTRTNQSISLIIKLVIYQFINTGLIYYGISLAKPLYSPGQDKYTDNNGLVSSISWIITFSTLIQIVLNIIYFPDLFRRLKIWWKYRNLYKEDTVQTFQVKLNKEFQFPEFDLADWYSFFILQLFMTAFYSYLIPAIIPIIILGNFIQYWLCKIILFKRSSLYYTFNFNLTRSIRRIFQSSVFIFAAGNFLFAWHIKNAMNIFNIIGLGISFLFLVFIVFIPQKLQRRILGQYQRCQKHIYDDCVADGKFYQTYWKQNPATCLVKESDVTGRKMIFNPVQKVVFGKLDNFLDNNNKL